MASSELTTTEYIRGHLANRALDLQTGELTSEASGFWQWHLDTFVFALFLGLIPIFLLYRVSVNATPGVPTKAQAFVELMFEFFDKQTTSLVGKKDMFVAPLAITIFIWVLAMNTMDVLPIDIMYPLGLHWKIVPTTDLNQTFAMAIMVFLLTVYRNFASKGAGGFAREVLTHPFGKYLFPANILLRILEEIARPLSLAMRLFGNLFAAEVIFVLIATLPFFVQWMFGGPWAVYHILVVPLQAYLFATLASVYMAVASQSHDH